VWAGASSFLQSLLYTVNEDWRTDRRIKGRVIQVRSGPMIDQARNDIVKAFLALDDKPEWLLMLDADMVWSPSDIRRLFEAADEVERPVIGALCFAGHVDDSTVWPVILQATQDADGVGHLSRVEDYPRDAICRVVSTGAAFLLIHRRVFTQILDAVGHEHPAPWFAISYLERSRLGEDVHFCIGCGRQGIPVHVHTGIKVGHVKSRILNEAVYEDIQAKRRQEERERTQLRAVK